MLDLDGSGAHGSSVIRSTAFDELETTSTTAKLELAAVIAQRSREARGAI